MNPCHEGPQGDDRVVARYANHFEVGQNAAEFVLDFGQLYSESEAVQIHTRIVTSPLYVKALLRLLEDSIKRHEQTWGEIYEQ